MLVILAETTSSSVARISIPFIAADIAGERMAAEAGIMDASLALLAQKAVNRISECATVLTGVITDAARLSAT